MLVRQILDWVEREPNGQPAHAAYALARACLFAPADSDHRAALEAALTVLIDKGRPDVREAIAHHRDPGAADTMAFSTLRDYLAQIGSVVRYLKPEFLDELSESCALEED